MSVRSSETSIITNILYGIKSQKVILSFPHLFCKFRTKRSRVIQFQVTVLHSFLIHWKAVLITFLSYPLESSADYIPFLSTGKQCWLQSLLIHWKAVLITFPSYPLESSADYSPFLYTGKQCWLHSLLIHWKAVLITFPSYPLESSADYIPFLSTGKQCWSRFMETFQHQAFL
jgi:hypothetical protein